MGSTRGTAAGETRIVAGAPDRLGRVAGALNRRFGTELWLRTDGEVDRRARVGALSELLADICGSAPSPSAVTVRGEHVALSGSPATLHPLCADEPRLGRNDAVDRLPTGWLAMHAQACRSRSSRLRLGAAWRAADEQARTATGRALRWVATDHEARTLATATFDPALVSDAGVALLGSLRQVAAEVAGSGAPVGLRSEVFALLVDRAGGGTAAGLAAPLSAICRLLDDDGATLVADAYRAAGLESAVSLYDGQWRRRRARWLLAAVHDLAADLPCDTRTARLLCDASNDIAGAVDAVCVGDPDDRIAVGMVLATAGMSPPDGGVASRRAHALRGLTRSRFGVSYGRVLCGDPTDLGATLDMVAADPARVELADALLELTGGERSARTLAARLREHPDPAALVTHGLRPLLQAAARLRLRSPATRKVAGPLVDVADAAADTGGVFAAALNAVLAQPTLWVEDGTDLHTAAVFALSAAVAVQ